MNSEIAPLYQVPNEDVLKQILKVRLLALEQLKILKKVSYGTCSSLYDPNQPLSLLTIETWHHLRMLLRSSDLMITFLEAEKDE